MSNKTPNYQLNQWEPGDKFLRTDFNEDNAKLDAALAAKADKTALSAKCEVRVSSYSGNGSYPRDINLGFRPKAVLLEFSNGYRGTGSGGLMLDSAPLRSGSTTYAQITDTGFQLLAGSTNQSGTTYYYICFR